MAHPADGLVQRRVGKREGALNNPECSAHSYTHERPRQTARQHTALTF